MPTLNLGHGAPVHNNDIWPGFSASVLDNALGVGMSVGGYGASITHHGTSHSTQVQSHHDGYGYVEDLAEAANGSQEGDSVGGGAQGGLGF